MITCPRCANSIAAADINEQGALARCARCGEVFSTLKDPPPQSRASDAEEHHRQA